MRSGGIALVVPLGLAALTGCNQIFGLDAVILVDAGPDSLPTDAILPTVSLTTITPTLDSFGHPNQQVEFHALSPAPHIQYGDIGGMLHDYTLAYESDGGIHVPDDYPGRATDWRLVYTPDGGIPHEVHWHPAASMGFLTELVGAERPAIPTGAALSLTPAATVGPGSYGGGFNAPRVYGTNAWSQTASPIVTGSTVTVNYTAATTVSQLGPKRAVGPMDDVVLVDFIAANTGCQTSKGAVPFQFTVAANASVVDSTPPRWTFQGTTYAVPLTRDMTTTLATAYGAASAAVTQYKAVSLVPTGAIPIFVRTEPALPLPLPLGVSLGECNVNLAPPNSVATNLPEFKSPNDTGLQGNGTVQFSLNRSPAMLPQMAIGYAATVTADPSVTNYAATFKAPLATAPTIDAIDVTVPAAAAASTVVTLPASTSSTATLAFGTAPPENIADVYGATLYKVEAGALVPVREFTFRASPLVFDRDLLEAGQVYIFEVRGITGATNAAQDDYRTWSANQSMSRTYTQTFQR